MESIELRYADLLSDAELKFLGDFKQLPRPARAVAVRMVMRKPRLFLAHQLQYPEIGAVHEAMAPLLEVGWIDSDPSLSIEDLFGVFSKTRIYQLLGLPQRDSKIPKAAMLERCRRPHRLPQRIAQWFPGANLRIFRLEIAAMCERLRLLYFGNFHQSWSEFVLTDLGLRRFEQVLHASEPFASRAHWDAFEQIYRCREQLRRQEDPHAILAEVPQALDDCPWLESRRQRLLFRIAQALERALQPRAALSVYNGIAHPGAAARAIRIREASEPPEQALSSCEAAIAACDHPHDRDLLAKAHKRLRRRLGLTTLPDPAKAVSPTIISVVLEEPSTRYCVEQLVADYLTLQDPDSRGYYVENYLLSGLFGLLCWRALFAPVSGAFFHGFHREPADLGDVQFFDRRRELFESCFAELDDGRYRHTIEANFASKNGIDNSFVAWPVLRTQLLSQALDCIPAPHMRAWFDLMAKDYQRHRTGHPDLIQLWPMERRYRLIEVKAPGDRLQDNQRRVLSLCAAFKIPVAVCKVQWSNCS